MYYEVNGKYDFDGYWYYIYEVPTKYSIVNFCILCITLTIFDSKLVGCSRELEKCSEIIQKYVKNKKKSTTYTFNAQGKML